MEKKILGFTIWALFLYIAFSISQWSINGKYWTDGAREGLTICLITSACIVAIVTKIDS